MELGINSLKIKGYVLHSAFGVASMSLSGALGTPCEWAMTRAQISPHRRFSTEGPRSLVPLTISRNMLHFVVKIVVDVRFAKLYTTPHSKGLIGTLVGTAVAYPLEARRVARIAGLNLPFTSQLTGLKLTLAHATLVHVVGRYVALHLEESWLPENLFGTRFGTSLCQTAGLIVGSVLFHMLDTLRKFAFVHFLIAQQPALANTRNSRASTARAGAAATANNNSAQRSTTAAVSNNNAQEDAAAVEQEVALPPSNSTHSLWSGVLWVVPSAACQVLLPHLFMHAFRSVVGQD